MREWLGGWPVWWWWWWWKTTGLTTECADDDPSSLLLRLELDIPERVCIRITTEAPFVVVVVVVVGKGDRR